MDRGQSQEPGRADDGVAAPPVEDVVRPATGRVRRTAWRAAAALGLATAAAAGAGWRLAEFLALALAASVVVALAAGLGRRDARHAADAGPATDDAVRTAALRASIRIGAVVVLAAGVVVALSLDWRLAAAGMAMTVAGLSLFGAPAWLAAVSDERERAARGGATGRPSPAPPGRARRARASRAG